MLREPCRPATRVLITDMRLYFQNWYKQCGDQMENITYVMSSLDLKKKNYSTTHVEDPI